MSKRHVQLPNADLIHGQDNRWKAGCFRPGDWRAPIVVLLSTATRTLWSKGRLKEQKGAQSRRAGG